MASATNVRKEIKRLSKVESGITGKEFGDLLAYIVDNPSKVTEIEKTFGYGNDNVKLNFLRKLLSSEQPGGGKGDVNLMKFIQSLKNTTFDAKKSDIFKLDQNTKFFGLSDETSKLFIRKCYGYLLDVIQDVKIRKLRITGNPGIGKTFFGYYLLYDLIKKNETIVYDLHTMKNNVIVFDNGNGYYFNETVNVDIIRSYLHNENNWYIVDGKSPNKAVAKTILICSPKKDHFTEFDKNIPYVRIMPAWTWEEIEYCRQKIFCHLKKSVVWKLYLKWGGIPRHILQSTQNDSMQLKLQQAIDSCDERILHCIGESDSNEDVSHKLIHIWTNVPENNDILDIKGKSSIKKDRKKVKYIDEGEYYTQTIIKFASNYVGEKVTEKLKIHIMTRLQSEVEACVEGGSINNAYFGCFFEQIVYQMFRKGGSFRVRSLEPELPDNSEYSHVSLPKQDDVLKFSEVKEIEINKYYQPLSPTFPAIDSIIAPSKLFQTTIATSHPIKLSGLKLLEKKLETDEIIKFYFVVPAKLFKGYKKQDVVTTKNDIVQRYPPWVRNKFKQYALEINLSTELEGEIKSSEPRNISGSGEPKISESSESIKISGLNISGSGESGNISSKRNHGSNQSTKKKHRKRRKKNK